MNDHRSRYLILMLAAIAACFVGCGAGFVESDESEFDGGDEADSGADDGGIGGDDAGVGDGYPTDQGTDDGGGSGTDERAKTVDLGFGAGPVIGNEVPDSRIQHVYKGVSVRDPARFPTYYDGVANVYWQIGEFNQTDLDKVEERFQIAAAMKDAHWTHGVYLLLEEVFAPHSRNFGEAGVPISQWVIAGEKTLAGITVKALQPWYVATFGAWDQKWFNTVRDGNLKTNDRIVQWSTYYARQLYEAWHVHMHSLGKQSMIIGLTNLIKATTFDSHVVFKYGLDTWDFIRTHYDAAMTYTYPKTIAGTGVDNDWGVANASLVAKRFGETFAGRTWWYLSANWGDGNGTSDKTVQFAEYQAVLPYVDVIGGRFFGSSGSSLVT